MLWLIITAFISAGLGYFLKGALDNFRFTHKDKWEQITGRCFYCGNPKKK
jgi:hypothetical protein